MRVWRRDGGTEGLTATQQLRVRVASQVLPRLGYVLPVPGLRHPKAGSRPPCARVTRTDLLTCSPAPLLTCSPAHLLTCTCSGSGGGTEGLRVWRRD